jgi:hypothetical protein
MKKTFIIKISLIILALIIVCLMGCLLTKKQNHTQTKMNFLNREAAEKALDEQGIPRGMDQSGIPVGD